jgi:DNA-binding transcriptional ArsR family regulator
MDTRQPFEQLERHFHEPARLAILSLLAAAEEPLPVTQIREALDLTFGNMERHLKVLAEAGIVAVAKVEGEGRARTVASLTEEGRRGFAAYLASLEKVLVAARESLHGKAATSHNVPDAGSSARHKPQGA